MVRSYRWLGAVVAVSLAIACSTDSSEDDGSPGRDGEPEGDGSAAPEVARVEASGDVPWGPALGAMDGGLVGLRTGLSEDPQEVVVSHDGGRVWAVGELPGRPVELELIGLEVTEELAAVVGTDTAPASAVLPASQPQFFVWTTSDGDEWHRHVFATEGGVVGSPVVRAVGDVLVALASSAGGFNLFTSGDGGATWRRAEVSGLAVATGKGLTLEVASADAGGALELVLVPDQAPEGRWRLTSGDDGATWTAGPCDAGCPYPVQAGELASRSGQVSTDGGETWHEVETDPLPPSGSPSPSSDIPTPSSDDPTFLSSVHEVPGGWLASAHRPIFTSEIAYGALLLSDDGRSWRQLLPADPCAGGGAGIPNSHVGAPTRFGGRWYVPYDCSDLETPLFGVVYAGSEDGREFAPVEASEREAVALGDPVVDGDRLLVPEYDDEEELVALTTIG